MRCVGLLPSVCSPRCLRASACLGCRFAKSGRRGLVLSAVVVALLSAAPAFAQQLPGDYQMAGRRMREAFASVAAPCRMSVVRVLRAGEAASLGVVVSADGFILTKASELNGPVTVLLPDGAEVEAESVAVDGATDLAVLQVHAANLKPVRWANEQPEVGSWLISVGPQELPTGVGVVSVAERAIAAQRGVLGIVLDDLRDGPTVAKVYPNSGAARAGLQEGDIITTLAGEPVRTRSILMDRLSHYRPGDTLPLSIRRGEQEEQVTASLGNEWSAFMDRQARQNLMGGALSVRSGGFERAMQHDTVLRPVDCGGPIVNLQGHVVGLNIARAGRVETYALSSATIQPILQSLLRTRSETVSTR